ncbi:MAG: hypothetical protein IKR34_04830 [Candidatus Gastranaerophilales bacterium]|nr:hypothetical protein [Candidatus Gastranaerophilales bacterium]
MITLNNFSNLFKRNYSDTIQLQKPNSSSPIKNTNLSPLSKDTVSFTGINKDISNDDIENMPFCEAANGYAYFIQETMVDILSNHFNSLIYDKSNNPNGVINPIEGRIKTPESIHEKTVSRLLSALKPKKVEQSKSKKRNSNEDLKRYNGVFSPYSTYDIMDKIRDISGTQITIRDIDTQSDEIIKRLCEMIESENLVVDEIENHTSSSAKPYFSQKQLYKLLECVNVQRSANGLSPIVVKSDTTESGYMALHLSFDLKNKKIFDKDNGLNERSFHELQIIGSDVGKLKDIENFCYKLAASKPKSIKQGDYAYDAFVEYFYTYYPKHDDNSSEAKKIRKYFKDYTKKAYELQRNRKPTEDAENDVTNWAYRYPTIEECGLGGLVPDGLDFNILARLKRDLDDVYKVKRNVTKILTGKETEIDNAGKITYKKQSKKAH